MRIFVENLTDSVTKNDLLRLFEVWGKVGSVTIENDKFSGKPGGFVEMPERHEALEVIKNINGVNLFGKSLNLSAMRERVDRRSGADTRSSQERRASEDRRIVADRRIKSVGYAFDDRRVNSERRAELDRRQIIERRMFSERRSTINRRQ